MDGLSARRGLVWVTRAEPGAARTAVRLRGLGFEPLAAPLIDTRPLAGPRPDLAGVAALAFTSRAGVTAFVERAGNAPDLPVFTVGDATAEAAHAQGFAAVRSAAGDGADLLALLLAEAPPGAVLHAGAAVPAFDLIAGLTAAGREARLLPLYETVAAAELPTAAALAFDRSEVAVILVHSPAAAGALAAFADADPMLTADLGATILAALSERCASPLHDIAFAGRVLASRPDESSLLEALLGAAPPRG